LDEDKVSTGQIDNAVRLILNKYDWDCFKIYCDENRAKLKYSQQTTELTRKIASIFGSA
jgi:hypothetical protein